LRSSQARLSLNKTKVELLLGCWAGAEVEVMIEMIFRLFHFVDAIYDNLAERLAESMSCNVETFAQNKAARELSGLSDQQLHQKGLTRDKLQHGSKAYPWISPYAHLSRHDLEKSLHPFMVGSVYKPKDNIIFRA